MSTNPQAKDKPMTDIHSFFDENLKEVIDKVTDIDDISSDAATKAMKNLEIFTKCRPPMPAPKPEPICVPVTRLAKLKAGVSRVWDNETTRVLIKAGGAFAGVAVVAYSTIHKDHVLERQALAQANQRPS